jgi:hypothetical protein
MSAAAAADEDGDLGLFDQQASLRCRRRRHHHRRRRRRRRSLAETALSLKP